MAAKKSAKKATEPAAKKAAKKVAKTATKSAAKKVAKAPATPAAAKHVPRPPLDAVARAAYLNYRRRVEQGLPGDSKGDWLFAERQLMEAAEAGES